MIRSLFIAKTGLEAQQTNLDVITNNLANVSTNGFKKSRAVFEDLLYQNVRQPAPSLPSRRSCRPACRSVPVCAPSPPSASTPRATPSRPATPRTS